MTPARSASSAQSRSTGTTRARSASTARARPAENDERPLGELLTEVTAQLQQLVRKEMELARVETKEQITRAGKGAGAFGAAGAMGFVALILLASAAAWGLAEIISTGLAFLVVGVVFLAIAGALAAQGKAKLARFSPVPQQTVETVKEDVEAAKDSLQRGINSPEKPNSDAWGR